METMTKPTTPRSFPFTPAREVANDHQDHKLGEFEVLALPFMQQLFRTALIITGSPRLAKNLFYDTCLQVRHVYNRFHNDKDFGLWMFRVLFAKSASH
jgi:DNA-directed RNA polymerase specialized sigma24 family protein